MAHSLSKTELIERLQGVIKDVELLPEDIFKNQDGRKAVKAKVSAIADHCESPEDRMQRLWTQVDRPSAQYIVKCLNHR